MKHCDCSTWYKELRLPEARAERLGRLFESAIARQQVVGVPVPRRGSEALVQMTPRDHSSRAHVDCGRFGVVKTDQPAREMVADRDVMAVFMERLVASRASAP